MRATGGRETLVLRTKDRGQGDQVTTSATVLARAIFRDGVKFVTAGGNPLDLKRGIDLATGTVVASLSRSVAGQAIAQVAWVALLHAIGSLDALLKNEEHDGIATGIRIVRRALEEPLRQIVNNAGKVTRVALQNAASIAGLMLTTEALVCESPHAESSLVVGDRTLGQ